VPEYVPARDRPELFGARLAIVIWSLWTPRPCAPNTELALSIWRLIRA